MSDPAVITALFTGLSGLIAAFTMMFVQLSKIHKAVNSNMTKALNEIKALNERLNVIAGGDPDPGAKPKPRR